MLKRGFLLCTFLLMFALLFAVAGCAEEAEEPAAPAAPEETDEPEEAEEPEEADEPEEVEAAGEPILIGNIQDMSGPTSVWSQAVTLGVEKAVEEINAAGGIDGRPLEIITYDARNDVQEAITAYNRLVDTEDVSVIIGPPISGIAIALAPIVEEIGVPIVGSFIDERATTQEDGTPWSYMFLMQPSATQQARIIAGYAMEEEGMKRFALLYDQANAYSVSLANPFKKFVEEHGGEIVMEELYTGGDRDFRTQLDKIRGADVDALFSPNYIGDLTLIVEQSRGMGLDIPILAELSAAHPFASMIGEIADNIFLIDNVDYEEDALKDLFDAYVEEHGERPLNKYFLGYDNLLVVAEAIRDAGSDDPEDITNALKYLSGVEGTTGVISIDPETHRPLGLSMVIFKIVEGEYVAQQRFLID